jgi:hypothetical protein
MVQRIWWWKVCKVAFRQATRVIRFPLSVDVRDATFWLPLVPTNLLCSTALIPVSAIRNILWSWATSYFFLWKSKNHSTLAGVKCCRDAIRMSYLFKKRIKSVSFQLLIFLSHCYVCTVLCILSHCVVVCTVCVWMCTGQLPPGYQGTFRLP